MDTRSISRTPWLIVVASALALIVGNGPVLFLFSVFF
jgi:hypothetical protein